MSDAIKDGSIAKNRLDALADAVFGVAMTLLVINIQLPDDFKPANAAELWRCVAELQSQFIVYVITFFVVGLRWLGNTQLAEGRERVSFDYGKWMLLNLFVISCMPFSTMMIGRFDDFSLSVSIYAANMIVSVLITMRLHAMSERESGRAVGWRDFDPGLWMLIGSALLSAAVGYFSPSHAMLPYLLNILNPALSKVVRPQKRPKRRLKA